MMTTLPKNTRLTLPLIVIAIASLAQACADDEFACAEITFSYAGSVTGPSYLASEDVSGERRSTLLGSNFDLAAQPYGSCWSPPLFGEQRTYTAWIDVDADDSETKCENEFSPACIPDTDDPQATVIITVLRGEQPARVDLVLEDPS